MEALRLVAAQRAQVVEHVRALDALGDDLEPEAAREVDRGAHDQQVVDVADDAGDERAVDLDLVERQPLEVGERGVAGAEVVEREPDAERAQPVEHLVGAPGVGHDRVLGQLARQPLAGHAPVREPLGHVRRAARRRARSRRRG